MTIDHSEATINPSVKKMAAEFFRIWNEPGETVDLGTAIDDAGHALRESHLEHFLKRVSEDLRHLAPTADGFNTLQSRILVDLAQLGQVSFDLTSSHLEILLQRDLPQGLIQFVQMARRQGAISDDDIFQAARNVAVMNVLQLMLGQSCEVTPAVFAYSMLYPYTDNYLDNPAIRIETKREFNSRLEYRLAGESVEPANPQEKAIFDLIGTI